jgi:hypothetical protein
MQLHISNNTVFAYNGWSRQAPDSDIGFGNNPGFNPDWTDAKNAKLFTTRRLQVLVK